MSKVIAILFLTTYLFSTTELFQLLKLPAFVSHFIEHKQENKDITLWEFICIHYAHGDVKDADYDKDMKLPFKSNANCTLQISIVTPPSIPLVSNNKFYKIPKTSSPLLNHNRISSAHLSSIWQPPRSC